MITSGVDLDLPKSSEKFAEKKEYINISIDKKFVIYLQDNIVKERDLVKKIQALVKEKPKVHILLYGDKDVSYGKIIHIFSLLKQASINNLTLVTEEY
jgi:biopolymer transport protein TolR